MNKIYFAEAGDGDYGGGFFSAPTSKVARSIAYTSDIICNYIDSYVDFSVRLVRLPDESGKRKPVTTNLPDGELTVQQIIDHGLSWFGCSE